MSNVIMGIFFLLLIIAIGWYEKNAEKAALREELLEIQRRKRETERLQMSLRSVFLEEPTAKGRAAEVSDQDAAGMARTIRKMMDKGSPPPKAGGRTARKR